MGFTLSYLQGVKRSIYCLSLQNIVIWHQQCVANFIVNMLSQQVAHEIRMTCAVAVEIFFYAFGLVQLILSVCQVYEVLRAHYIVDVPHRC